MGLLWHTKFGPDGMWGGHMSPKLQSVVKLVFFPRLFSL